ncbi:MAG TPA: DUF222 domain-containing protein, partial [Acidimicrobiia bacterium]|nr:DUF222 domain-containing protein [Acidimicrobiia bacterium]
MCSTGTSHGPEAPEVLHLLNCVSGLLDTHDEAALFGLTDDEVMEATLLRERLARRFDGLGCRLVRELDGRKVATRVGAVGTAAVLRGRLLVGPTDAHTRVRNATAMDGPLTATRDALLAGDISYQHVTVIVSVVGRVHSSVPAPVRGEVETYLLQFAAQVDPTELARYGRIILQTINPGKDGDDDQTRRAKRALYLRDREDGMTDLHAVLDPEGAALAAAALDPLAAPRPGVGGERDPRSAAHRRADALIEVFRKILSTGDLPATGGIRPHISVLVPYSTLIGEPATPDWLGNPGWSRTTSRPAGSGGSGGSGWPGVPDGAGGSGYTPGYTFQGAVPLPKDVLDRVCCDASVRRIVFAPDGQPLDVGRSARTVTPAIRAAVIARDICCTFPFCDRPPSWGDIHHLHYWNNGGPTSLANSAVVCSFHHEKPHHEGWKLRLGPAGVIEWQAPYWVDPDQKWRSNPIRQARHPYPIRT